MALRTGIDDLWSRLDRSHGPDACWPGSNQSPGGYSMVWLAGKTRAAHRMAWVLENGRIPDGLVIDHVCRNRACANPKHLRAVTQRENLMAAESSVAAKNASKTHCNAGHEYSPENTYFYTYGRKCRLCIEAWKRANA